MSSEIKTNGKTPPLAELDLLVLTEDLPRHGLRTGDVGTVVHVYRDGQAYEAEFASLGGATLAVATVEAAQARPVTSRDIAHARLAESLAA